MITLTRLERYNMSNQLRILEALYPDEAKDIAVKREALERGYEMLYGWDMDFIYDGEDVMTVEESKEVWDTMDMFDAIDRSIQKLDISKEELNGMPCVRFVGYDGNNESKFMGFAAFTVERLKRFEYLPMAKSGYWNSHMPARPIYQRMLEVWRKIPRQQSFDMTRDELFSVLSAAIHPENR